MLTIEKLFLRNMIIAIFTAMGFLYLFWIYTEYTAFVTESRQMKIEYIKSQKKTLKHQVTMVLDYIQYMEAQTETQLKKTIQNRVKEAHALASNLYEENKEVKPKAEIVKMIKDALRPIRFNNGNGYFFAFSMDGTEILFADHPEMEGRNMLSVQGPGGDFVVKDMIEILKEKSRGFYQYTWTKPGDTGRSFQKIAYVKYFKPYGWGIGTGIYIQDMKEQIQTDVLERVSNMRFGQNGYFFGSEYGGFPLFTNGKITRGGDNLWNLTDSDGVKIIQEMDRVSKKPEGGFIQYSWHKLDSQIPIPKLVYVQNIPDWKWIIGAGIYIDAIDSTILSWKNTLYKNFRNKAVTSFILFFAMSLVIYFWARHLAGKVQQSIKTFGNFFEEASLTSTYIDPESLPFFEFRNIALAANQMVEIREQTLEALELSEKRYEKSQLMGKVGNWEYHISTQNFWGSKGTKRIYGFDLDKEFLTVADVERCIPQKTDIHQIMMSQVNKSSTIPLEFNITTQNTGEQKTVITMMELEEDDKGTPHKINGVLQDVTQLKNLEKELRQAHKMEAVGTLSGGIAHEFNNILGVILGNAELAIEDFPQDDPRGYFLEEIKSASLRGKEIVSQLLSFSRRDEQHPKQLIKVNEIINNAISFLRASLPSTIQFSKSIQTDCHPIVGNPTQIHQVMINLCNNAAQAMETSGGRLSITLENVFLTKPLRSQDLHIDPGKYVRLSVSDTGQGISREIMDNIFNPFFTTKPVDKGSGMGLSVVHGIMKAHGGLIKIYSRPDEGTTCECYFPPGNGRPGTEIHPVGKIIKGKENILFVDDNVHVVKVGEQILEKLGYRAVTEENPEKALALFKKNPDAFDLVITDMTMPGMTGDQLIEKLIELKPHVRVIICSGYSSRMNKKEAARVGAAAYLMKPFEISVLAETVRRVLDTK
ncbi:Signal transduction histidine kinase [Desulfocicer vacuolatum DSM 3385]|uniref:histidine kinase n=1 Tax=Desulfocicer vacuolatum DSM 3385 TaxID=1121400 RepID=A0A1W2AI75_9BACT|nr:cache domain-containing protein [Desulfocicer vacuolatum]SMC60212.1 Signal transduction histidine kinase [Desulfocicer vacuolatum DSM 3385]